MAGAFQWMHAKIHDDGKALVLQYSLMIKIQLQ